MKKIIFIFISLFVLLIISIAVFLSTKGYETKKFNTFISEKIKSTEEKLDVNLKTVKIKLDLKKFDLFLSTNEPVTKYENINLPISRLSIYFDIFSLFKKDPYIKSVYVVFGELKVS